MSKGYTEREAIDLVESSGGEIKQITIRKGKKDVKQNILIPGTFGQKVWGAADFLVKVFGYRLKRKV